MLVDDHEIMRDGLRRCSNGPETFEVVVRPGTARRR